MLFGLCAALLMERPVCHGECEEAVDPIAVWSVVGGAAILLVLAIVALRGSPRAGNWTVPACAVGLVVGGFAYFSVPAFRSPNYTHEPLSPLIPAVGAVYWLAMIGALMCAVGGRALRPRRLLVAGAVVGVVLAVTASAIGWWSGLPRRYVDASTAVEAEVPAIPDRLGERMFRISLGQLPRDERSESVQVFAAGPGFVVLQGYLNRITAHDASGRERWHFRKTGPGALLIGVVQVYDQGRTIILALRSEGQDREDPPLFVALDAMTGHQLWTGSGSRLNSAFHAGGQAVSPFLVARGKEVWTAFEPRTGEVTWEIPSPTPCTTFRTGDTADVLVGLHYCADDDDAPITFRAVTVDPATGKVLMDRQVDRLPRHRDGLVHFDVRPAGAGGTALRYYPNTPENPNGANFVYVDGDSGAVTEFADSSVNAFLWPTGEFTVSRSDDEGEGVGLYGPDGNERCRSDVYLPIDLQHYGRARAAWLGEQLVFYDYDGGRDALHAVERTDCRLSTTRDLSGIVVSMAAAPGVLALVTIEGSELFVEGYA